MNKKSKRNSKGLYRDSKLLVIREGARFPHKCAICNSEDDVELVDFVFERKQVHGLEARVVHSALTAAADLLSATKYTGPVQAEIPLCAGHRRRRIQRAGIGVGTTILAISVLLIQKAMGIVIVPPGELGFLDIAIYNFIAFAMIFVGITLIFTTIFDSQNLWFKATKYYDRFVWVTGAGAAFLGEQPQYENQHRTLQADDFGSRGGSRGDGSDLSAEELIRRARLGDDD